MSDPVTPQSGNTASRHEVEPPVWTEEMLARRRKRSLVLGAVLVALVGLFFAVTVVKIGGNIVTERPL